MVLKTDKSVLQLSRDLDIPPSTLSSWVKQSVIERGLEMNECGNIEDKREIKRLRKEIGQLKMEMEIIKIATTFFAKVNE